MDAPQRPTRRAIALEYDGAGAPRISQRWDRTRWREQIIALAREHGVPLLENAELAVLLAQLDLGDEIPETLYRCVAQIIAFAYRLRGRFPHDWTAPDSGADASATVPAQWPAPSSAGPHVPRFVNGSAATGAARRDWLPPAAAATGAGSRSRARTPAPSMAASRWRISRSSVSSAVTCLPIATLAPL